MTQIPSIHQVQGTSASVSQAGAAQSGGASFGEALERAQASVTAQAAEPTTEPTTEPTGAAEETTLPEGSGTAPAAGEELVTAPAVEGAEAVPAPLATLGITAKLASILKQARANVPEGASLHIFSTEAGRFHGHFVAPGQTLADRPGTLPLDLANVSELTPEDFDGGPATTGLVPPSPPGFGDAGGVPVPPPIPPDEIVLETEPVASEEEAEAASETESVAQTQGAAQGVAGVSTNVGPNVGPPVTPAAAANVAGVGGLAPRDDEDR